MTKICMYTDVIDSSKMGKLPDAEWRLAIELAILSTEYDPLPSFDDLKWLLHREDDDLECAIEFLVSSEIINIGDDGILTLTHLKDAAYDLQSAKEIMENAIS